MNKNHKSDKKYTPDTKPSEIFAGNKSCVLSPETTEGPFCELQLSCFVPGIYTKQSPSDVTGESIRSNLVDGELGVPLHLDIQLVDVDTCKPIPNVYLEIWGTFPILPSIPLPKASPSSPPTQN